MEIQDFFKMNNADSLQEQQVKICPRCYTSLNTLEESGKAGCPQCYEFFREDILRIRCQYREIHEPVRG